MKFSLRYLLVALAAAGSLTACGSKDKAADTAATQAAPAAAAPAEAPAAPAADATPPASAAPDATFDLSAVPVSTATLGRFPYLGKLQGYKINVPDDSVEFEFDRTYVYDGKNIIPVEGRVLRREYIAINEQKKTSELMQQRNYENLVKSLGGVKVSSGKLPSEAVEKIGNEEYHKHDGNIDPGNQVDTYIIRLKDKEVWVQMVPGDYRYYLNVTERAAMPQRAAATSADELKKN